MNPETTPVVEDDEHDERSDGAPEHLWQSPKVRWSALAGVLLAIGFVADQLGADETAVNVIYVLATLAGVRFFAIEAVRELVLEREIDIELLMTVAAFTAGALGLWSEAAALGFLYSISEALESFTDDRTRGAIRALMDLAPKRVTRLRPDGTEDEVDVDALAVDDRFLVRPGQSVATDGRVEEGSSAIDEAAVTGESVPVDKAPGAMVFAGTLNTTGALVVRVTATAENNTLAKIVRLVSEAQEAKGQGERFIRRFARVYSPAVLVTGIAVALIGGLVTGDWSEWTIRAATVLVAAAPCALVIAIPITYVAAIGSASRKGILIKGGIYLEQIAQLRVLALDKTGTLTSGQPQVVEFRVAPGTDEDHALRIAAAVEQRSEHPLARAVVTLATSRGVAVPAATDFEALVGAGAQARIDGQRFVVGSPTLMDQRGVRLDNLAEVIPEWQQQGRTAVVLADETKALAAFAIADVIRPQARDAMDQLRQLRVEHLVMLTGDNPLTAAAVAEQVGVDIVEAELKPEDKSARITRLVDQYGHVGMVGDGVNDAPALAAASVGIAMGTAGSDVALETADVALMADDLTKLVEAIRIGRRTRRVVRQNVALGIAILVVLVPGALLGLLALPAAVLAHEVSELLVIANGLRLARR
jgi:Cd2+/Zn2+-exporting ATPase